jgi:hypothetical protein
MHELFAKTTLVHRKPIRVTWWFSSLLCVGHAKRYRTSKGYYYFSIGIFLQLQAIGLECAARVYPTLEKGDLKFKLSKSRNIKMQLPPLSNTWSLGKHFNQVYYAEGCFFLREKNRSSLGRSSEFWYPQIHLLLRFSQSAEKYFAKIIIVHWAILNN